jgi:predicted metalloenzyme YecM
MRYRIIEVIEAFYPQEKKYFFSKWEYIDNMQVHYTWGKFEKHHSNVATYDEALKVVEKRKQHLIDRKFKKIHNL